MDPVTIGTLVGIAVGLMTLLGFLWRWADGRGYRRAQSEKQEKTITELKAKLDTVSREVTNGHSPGKNGYKNLRAQLDDIHVTTIENKAHIQVAHSQLNRVEERLSKGAAWMSEHILKPHISREEVREDVTEALEKWHDK